MLVVWALLARRSSSPHRVPKEIRHSVLPFGVVREVKALLSGLGVQGKQRPATAVPEHAHTVGAGGAKKGTRGRRLDGGCELPRSTVQRAEVDEKARGRSKEVKDYESTCRRRVR